MLSIIGLKASCSLNSSSAYISRNAISTNTYKRYLTSVQLSALNKRNSKVVEWNNSMSHILRINSLQMRVRLFSSESNEPKQKFYKKGGSAQANSEEVELDDGSSDMYSVDSLTEGSKLSVYEDSDLIDDGNIDLLGSVNEIPDTITNLKGPVTESSPTTTTTTIVSPSGATTTVEQPISPMDKYGYFYETVHTRLSKPKRQPDYTPPVSAETLFSDGWAHHEKGEYELALDKYNESLAMDPYNWQVHSNKGNALAALKKYEEAVAAYKKSIGLRPSYKTAYYNQGTTLIALGRHEEAIASFDAATKIDPNFREAHSNKGAALMALGKYEEAASAFMEALKADSSCKEAKFNRGYALFMARKFEESLECYTEAANEYEKSLISLQKYKKITEEELEASKAEEDGFKEYLFIDKKESGNALETTEVEDPSIKYPALRDIHRKESFEIAKQKQWHPPDNSKEVAQAKHKEFQELQNWLSNVHNNRGNSLLALKRYEEAIKAYDDAIVQNPANARAHCNKGLSHFALKQFSEALSCYQEAITHDSQFKEAFLGKGDSLFSMKKYSEAIAEYNNALQIDPNYQPAKASLQIALNEHPQ